MLSRGDNLGVGGEQDVEAKALRSVRRYARRWRAKLSQTWLQSCRKMPSPAASCWASDSQRWIDIKRNQCQNFSIYDIRDLLREEGQAPGTSTIAAILKDEGFSKLPRRGDDERMEAPLPLPADAAKIPLLTLKPRRLRTKFGGLFLFLPLLAKIPLEDLLHQADF